MIEITYKRMTRGMTNKELMELAENNDDMGTYAFLELEEKGYHYCLPWEDKVGFIR